MSFKKQLKAGNKAWKKANNERDDVFASVEPGKYKAQLEKVELSETKKGDALLIKRKYVVKGGDFDGKAMFDTEYLGTDFGMMLAQQWIEMLGYEVPSMDKLEAVLKEIGEAHPIVNLTYTVDDNGYGSTKLIDVMGEEEEEEEEEPEKGKEEEEEEEIEVGSTVTFEDEDGDEITGKVTKIKKEVATVEDEDEEEYEVDLEDLTLVEEEEEPEKGKEEEEEEEPPVKKVKKKKGGDNKNQLISLQEFVDSQELPKIGLKFKEPESLMKLIGKYEYKKKELSKSEMQLLKDLDLEDCIIK